MKELIKICLKENKSELLKDKNVKAHLSEITKNLQNFKINCNCKQDIDYFKLCIIYQGVKNKQTFENIYEDLSKELIEIWHTLEFNKKNEFLMNAAKEQLEKMPYFTYNDAQIYIPFFDELLNAFYTKQLAIFELPQFFKLYKEFKERMMDSKQYHELPFKHGFVDVQFLAHYPNGFGFYVKENHSIYVLDNNQVVTRLPLSLSTRSDCIDVERGSMLVEAILKEDQVAVVQWCINSGQINERAKKQCINLLNKLKGIKS